MGKFVDLSGNKYGSLTVVKRSTENTKDGKPQWVCSCDCGNQTIVSSASLKNGNTKSCGCLRYSVPKKRVIDLTGLRFGKLKVLKSESDNKWVCQCDCGNVISVKGKYLRTGDTKSCGCLRKESLKERATKHGMTGTRIHNIWQGMLDRCRRRTNNAYPSYGGRGITVCDEWQEFIPFYEWSMSHGYTDNLTIDRIDVNGNYEPLNCRWTTYKEQANNRRNNHLLTYNGKTQTLEQWSCEYDIDYHKLSDRINRLQWSIEKALTTP